MRRPGQARFGRILPRPGAVYVRVLGVRPEGVGLLFSQFRDGAIGQVLPAGQAGGRLAGSLLGRVLTGSGERRVRLRTLTLIRWIAIIGQAFTVALVHFSLEFRLPLGPLLGAIGLSALINLVLSGFAATTRLTERSAALLLGYDILQLAFLLGLTGGLQNPFSILLIVPVTLSATTLVAAHHGRAVPVRGRRGDPARAVPERPALAPRRLRAAAALRRGAVARAGAGHRPGRGLRLAGRRRGAAPVGCARGDPDGARPRAAALGAGRACGRRRARARQPARDDRGDRARARQQRAGRQPAGRGRRPAGQRGPALPRDPALAQPRRARARSMRRSPACRSRTCWRRSPNSCRRRPEIDLAITLERCDARRARSRSWCRPRSSGTRSPT